VAERVVTSTVSNATITALQPYVHSDASGWTLDAPTEVRASVSQTELAAIEQNIALTNADVRAGLLTMNADDTITTKGAHGYAESHWWGIKVYMDSYLTSKVLGMGAGAGAVATIVGAIAATGGVAAVIGGSIALMMAEIAICREPNGGVTLYDIYGVWGCNPF
jgi:hypothetical protein